MIGLPFVYALEGVMMAGAALAILIEPGRKRRLGPALFWGLLALSFLAGDRLGDLGNGVLVLALAVIGGWGWATRAQPEAEQPPADASALRLFSPILLVPAVALAGGLAFKTLQWGGRPLVDVKQSTVVGLAMGASLGLAAAMALLRPSPMTPLRETRRLLEAVGAAAMLPQLLAALGAVFALAGVGHAVGELATQGLPLNARLPAVAIYGVGMALFTMITGNAFAALPVMLGGVGAPVLIMRFGGDPAAVGAMGMLCGYCGTLMTPMASFNIIPAALLDLPQGAVIRAQAPTALIVLAGTILLMDRLAFHV